MAKELPLETTFEPFGTDRDRILVGVPVPPEDLYSLTVKVFPPEALG
jgi:hypothetical protein